MNSRPSSPESLVVQLHKRLGPGFAESIYEDALTIELELAGLKFDRQRQVVVRYRGRPLRPHRLDLVVESQVILELKAVERVLEVHKAQLLSYLVAAELPVGLLFNFNAESVSGSMKRVINKPKTIPPS